MTPHILFYVSGHGYGHARRTALVIEALRRRLPQARVSVRTAAPARLFAIAGLAESDVAGTQIDCGMVEKNSTTMDGPATAAHAAAFLGRRDQIAKAELNALAGQDVSLIVADIPFLAAEVAGALGVGCMAMGNFTWDWIYEPYCQTPQFAHLPETIRSSYGKMIGVLRLPFSHEMPMFRRVIDLPLVAISSRRPQTEVRRLLGLEPKPTVPLVLLAMRGGLAAQAIIHGAATANDYNFLYFHDLPADMPGNISAIPVTTNLDFSEIVSVCDIVISKLGYGTLADVIAGNSRLLWPRREDFREDLVLEPQAQLYLRTWEIPRAEMEAGNWRPWLEKLMRVPPPPQRLALNGAAACAEHIATMALGA